MPERVLAEGSFDGVAAAAEGPPLAYASRSGQGVNTGQAWDLAAGSALGPPIPDFPVDRAEWAFGVPAARRSSRGRTATACTSSTCAPVTS
ncbi:hypothetical protein LUX57_39650 [Actinomadura madurae]|uniref:hypothetical protein n=1 Tax=Actinomadura madurae TaxID=1993 RepID=UPI0020D23551|nr:hypothetical protein [Actinomadura madurae]MCP9970545.1 hypothetical protein [Actinomadura madurae]